MRNSEEEETLYLVLPAYNEEETIRTVVEEWYPIVERIGPKSRLVIVNDGSRDATGEILQECAKTHPQLVPLTKKNGGHGAAVLYAYHYALEQGADYVFQTDSDGQTVAEEFGPFWEQRHSYDMVIGNRCSRQDGASRVFVTKTLKGVIRLCFGVNVPDANTPFRLMKAGPLKENLELIPAEFNLSNVVLSVLYARKHQKVRYLPITFRPRQGGVNSIDLRKIVKIGWKALRDFRELDRTWKAQGV